MKLKPKKRTFGVEEGMFLGYMVNTKGIKVYPDKVEAVLSLPSPKCLNDVQRLNGKLASLNRFLAKSAEKSLPFFKTLKKCTKKTDFQWTTKEEAALKQMKNLIAELPTLTAPIEKEEPIIYLAAAREALGEYDIHYMPRVLIKGQILADFIVERPEDDSLAAPMEVEVELSDPWTLFTDGSSYIDGSRARLILTNPEGAKFTYALRFEFNATNNEADENNKADALSKIASTNFAHLTKQVLVEVLKEKSINEAEVLIVVEEEGNIWMTPIYEYLMEETLLAKKKKARPHMLDRTDFASWQQRIRLYCRDKENGVNILKLIDEGPERARVYTNLSPEEKDRVDRIEARGTMHGVQMKLVTGELRTELGMQIQVKQDRLSVTTTTENWVALDEEQLLFIAGGQDNVADEDMDEQPVQDLALNVDNVFQDDDCDAFDYDVDEAPTAQTMFMANISSANPVYDEATLFTEMHDAHTVVQARCLELEAELSKLRDKVQKDDHNELVKQFSNLEIVEEAKVERLLDRSLASACLYTKHSQEILEYVIGTCPNDFNQQDKKHATTPLTRKKTVRFENDHFGAIMGYGDYVIGDSMISRVYYMEGLGHNLFFVRQFCDSDLEVAFRKNSCYVQDKDGVELIKGSRGSNLYTISVEDMMKSSPICLLSKASKNKSWLWHRRLNHLNFGTINDLARKDLVRGLPRLKFEKDHLCSACQLGKSGKHTHTPKTKNTNLEVLNTLHMDLCGPMRVQTTNGKKYILVIVDDYSRFTWVKFLRSKDETPEFVIKFLKQIQVGLNKTVRYIRTDNGT
ncbi:retrovirus-related pol polyprotein from transposon TNT 1-94 [Tanacetum coccineum]